MKWIDDKWFIDDFNRAINIDIIGFVKATEVTESNSISKRTAYRMAIQNPMASSGLWYITCDGYNSEEATVKAWLKFYNQRPINKPDNNKIEIE